MQLHLYFRYCCDQITAKENLSRQCADFTACVEAEGSQNGCYISLYRPQGSKS